ncbi:phage tail sheath family protein [Ruminiclostridium herbifermentans]|uniref:Phage tail sheath family protein n=1 Tax=Ruminiclostridium herbifermentans TaxID=2488810 RepID=A0A4U7JDQ2_9FIRM|nr:phage tail sheath C-terminal domain-containing protein [Ruminiclostridium herbifermentans]QNU65812.1 phage tail sheath family protein [Ruminiclostridium herbifermentans]
MPNYLSPGVYVEEVSSGVKPIAGVGTSVGAFIGLTEKGTVGKATLVTNWSQYVSEFGGFIPSAYLSYAVYNFFAEGGTSCYVVRVAPEDAKTATYTVKDNSEDAVDLFEISARSKGAWGNRISFEIGRASNSTGTPEDLRFKLVVKYKESFDDEYTGDTEGEIVEIFDGLLMINIEEKINEVSSFVKVKVLRDLTSLEEMERVPVFNDSEEESAINLRNGADGRSAVKDYLNTETGIHAFDVIDEINIMAAPDVADLDGGRDIIIEMLNYCKQRGDCFFVADPPHGLTPSAVKEFKEGIGQFLGTNPLNSSYGALYYPWVFVNDPLTGKKKLVPPSGAVIGTYAYVDSTRGVHKAPAGTSDGYLDTAVGIERIITKGEQEILNPIGINVIRALPEGICIWGARTLSSDAEWQYINIRRLMMYIEESIDKGSQWVVFEPNDPSLWGKVKRNLSAFLTRVWRDGALYGSTQEEAFFIKVDEENNPPATRDVGQLIIEVGVAPVKPAEFVIIRVSQKTLAK